MPQVHSPSIPYHHGTTLDESGDNVVAGDAACPECMQSLKDSQWRGDPAQSPGAKLFRAEFKSCGCCSENANEHVFHHWHVFGYAPSRETTAFAGIENYCGPCRRNHDHAEGDFGGSLHEAVETLPMVRKDHDSVLQEEVSAANFAARLSEIEALMATQGRPYQHALVLAMIRRDRPIVRFLKERAGYACQFEGCTASIPTRGGTTYVEVAHLDPVSKGGGAVALNLVVLCPNHHKMVDLGTLQIDVSDGSKVEGTLNEQPFRIFR